MADQDELRLRIVPELDDEAVKRIKAQLDALYGQYPGMPPGSAPNKPAGDPDAPARKQRLADLKAEVALRDLLIRKENIQRQENIQRIQQEMALGRTSMQEGARLIAEQENLREQAADAAIEDYQKQLALANELNLTLSERASIEGKVFYATDRAKKSFGTMSRSMMDITSNTKSANIAFANFGRIVQDAPFGLLGISNNIDPLLNSFRQLKTETGGTGLALKAMGAQLLGPAGLIFLLGSALPTALLFLQKHLQDTKKEANGVTDAVRSLQEQISKGFAEAAAQMGIDELNAGLSVSTFRLEQEEKKLEDVKRQMTEYALRGMAMTEADRERGKALRDTQAQIEKNILREKDNVAQFQTQIALLKTREENEALYSQNSIGRAKTEQERAKAREEDNKALLENFSIMQPLLALQLTFNDALMESRDAYLAQAAAARTAQQAEQQAFDARIRREAQAGRDTTLTDDSDFERGIRQREELERVRIESLRRLGREEEAITLETEIRKREAVLNLLKLGITDQETIDQELANIEQEGAQRAKDAELTVADARAEAMTIYSDAVASGLGAIFGENKAIQSAQVVIDTYAGAQRAFAALAPNLPLQIAASGAVVAQGIATLRKINSTQKGTRSIGRSGASASSTPSPSLPFVNDLGAANMIAGTITPFNASMTPNINITANLDRQGLALAVRDGEADIATRQIPFAS